MALWDALLLRSQGTAVPGNLIMLCLSRNTNAPFPAEKVESIPIIHPTTSSLALDKSRGWCL